MLGVKMKETLRETGKHLIGLAVKIAVKTIMCIKVI